MIGRDSWIRVIQKYTIPTDQQNELTQKNGPDIQICREAQKYTIPTDQQNEFTQNKSRYLQVYLNVPGGDDYHALHATRAISFIGNVFDLSDEIFLVCYSIQTESTYYTKEDSNTYYGPPRRSPKDIEHICTREHVVYIPWENILAISYYNQYVKIIPTK